MVLAPHTDNLRLRAAPPPPARIFDYHRGQLSAFDAPGIEAFAVRGQLQATAGVVAVDDGGAEAARKPSLVSVPELETSVSRWHVYFVKVANPVHLPWSTAYRRHCD